MAYFVYMVRCADETIYTGTSTQVEKRIATHNRGKGAKYTRSRLPVTLVYTQCCVDKSAALRREWAIKQLTRVQKLALIAEVGIDLPNGAEYATMEQNQHGR